MVYGLDAFHAQDNACAQHPTVKVTALPAELLDGPKGHKLLRACRGVEETMRPERRE
jgi:hypothetical protein